MIKIILRTLIILLFVYPGKVLPQSQIIEEGHSIDRNIPAGYYDKAIGLRGLPLKSALHNIIKGHTKRSYSFLWSAFYTTDDKPNGTVWDIYSDVPDGSPNGNPPYIFNFGPQGHQCSTTPGTEGVCYNREHSFPRSWFDGSESDTMYTDLFHLYPVDSKVNSIRNNNPYGEVKYPSWTSKNGSKSGPSSIPGYSGTAFEPIDEYKGDLARTMLYMSVRYHHLIASWQPYADAILDGTLWPSFDEWQLNMLLKWHRSDPVSQKEIERNEEIYNQYQFNRNPFIDHPEFVDYIWAPTISIEEYKAPEFNAYILEGYLRIEGLKRNNLVYISNITGQVICSVHSTDAEIEFDSNRYPHGIYIVTVISNTGIAAKKVIF